MSPRRNHRAPARDLLHPARTPSRALHDALSLAAQRGSSTVSLRTAEAEALQQALDGQVQRITELEMAMSRVANVGNLAMNGDRGVIAVTIRQDKQGAYTDAYFVNVEGDRADEIRDHVAYFIEDAVEMLGGCDE